QSRHRTIYTHHIMSLSQCTSRISCLDPARRDDLLRSRRELQRPASCGSDGACGVRHGGTQQEAPPHHVCASARLSTSPLTQRRELSTRPRRENYCNHYRAPAPQAVKIGLLKPFVVQPPQVFKTCAVWQPHAR